MIAAQQFIMSCLIGLEQYGQSSGLESLNQRRVPPSRPMYIDWLKASGFESTPAYAGLFPQFGFGAILCFNPVSRIVWLITGRLDAVEYLHSPPASLVQLTHTLAGS